MSARRERLAEAQAWAGLRQAGFARSTGTLVAVFDGEAQGMDTEGGRWSLLCDDHAGILSVDTLAAARGWAPHPEEWCPTCMGEAD